MIDMLQTALFYAASFVVVLTVIVFVHEYGHYRVARWCGVKVETFSIGFGKEIFGYTAKNGTRWKFCLIPMGGYVKMFGDADPASSPNPDAVETFTDAEKSIAFHFKPLYKKAAVVFAGPLANFILTITVMTGLFYFSGKQTILPVVGEVVAGSAAEKAGIRVGDEFIAIGGKRIHAFADIKRAVTLNLGEPVEARIKRDGSETVISVTPEIKETTDIFGNTITLPVLGVASSPKYSSYHKLPPIDAFIEANKETYNFVTSTLTAVGQMIVGRRDVSEISGPIGIAKYSGQSMQQGVQTVIWFIAVLSANLGLVNLFPIPALDGGHLLYYAIEGLRGKPLADKFQEVGIKIGIALISLFAAFAVYNDIVKLFK
ncbi:MAG: RIP metalloprotease RseP [Rickettsiales bacterium]